MDREEAKTWIRKTCGIGWLPLVDEAYDKLPQKIQITAVYQKYAQLVFEIEPFNQLHESLLEKIQDKSLSICEKCGSVGATYTVNGWDHTRCAKHSEGGKLKYEQKTD